MSLEALTVVPATPLPDVKPQEPESVPISPNPKYPGQDQEGTKGKNKGYLSSAKSDNQAIPLPGLDPYKPKVQTSPIRDFHDNQKKQMIIIISVSAALMTLIITCGVVFIIIKRRQFARAHLKKEVAPEIRSESLLPGEEELAFAAEKLNKVDTVVSFAS